MLLPFDLIWEIIIRILNDGPEINTSRKLSKYDEDVYKEIISKVEEYFLGTVDHAERFNDLIKNIEEVDFTYRYKSEESIKLKLERLNMTKKLFKIANDVFAMRFIVAGTTEDLAKIVQDFVGNSPIRESCDITDQTLGKKNDDGYKGIHVYIRPNNHTFPIEVQFWTRTHALLNEYLHDNIYKIDDDGLNQYALDLRDWLEIVPSFSPGDGLSIKSYVDYIYEQAFSSKYEDIMVVDIIDSEVLEIEDWVEYSEEGDKNE